MFRSSLILIVNGYLKMQLITLCRVSEIFFSLLFEREKTIIDLKSIVVCFSFDNKKNTFKTLGGYKDVGYEYVIIDDCWMEMDRDPVTQELIPDRRRFPNGLKALADYVNIDIFRILN